MIQVFVYFSFSFYPIYNGPSNSHKVNKLCELMPYEFRIYASNEAGDGPYSSVSSFKTTKAPPPAVKGELILASFRRYKSSVTYICFIFFKQHHKEIKLNLKNIYL